MKTSKLPIALFREWRRPCHAFIILCFLISCSIGPLPQANADEFRLPAPGVMVRLSPDFNPPILKGIKVYPDNPFKFEFILDQGDTSVIASAAKQSHQEQLKLEAAKLIKYFLASLTIPENELWVNLSPYEKSRIIPHSFGLTEMGRDLLAEDYMLKQITASLIYPEDEVGRRFWKRIYQEADRRYGTTNIPINTFNKVWIVPEKAVVYENAKNGTAYVVESRLKVMLEQDYLSLEKHTTVSLRGAEGDAAISERTTSTLGSQIIREIVIPELNDEVNHNKNFARLRQVYNSLILATWYKIKIKDSILSQVFADKKKVGGIGPVVSLRGRSPKQSFNATEIASSPSAPRNDTDVEFIYQRYLQAFKKGVYNYIKEDLDPITQEIVPRKYFSGGVDFNLAMVAHQTDLNAGHAIEITEIKPNQDPLLSDILSVVDTQIYQSNLFRPRARERKIPTVFKKIRVFKYFSDHSITSIDAAQRSDNLKDLVSEIHGPIRIMINQFNALEKSYSAVLDEYNDKQIKGENALAVIKSLESIYQKFNFLVKDYQQNLSNDSFVKGVLTEYLNKLSIKHNRLVEFLYVQAFLTWPRKVPGVKGYKANLKKYQELKERYDKILIQWHQNSDLGEETSILNLTAEVFALSAEVKQFELQLQTDKHNAVVQKKNNSFKRIIKNKNEKIRTIVSQSILNSGSLGVSVKGDLEYDLFTTIIKKAPQGNIVRTYFQELGENSGQADRIHAGIEAWRYTPLEIQETFKSELPGQIKVLVQDQIGNDVQLAQQKIARKNNLKKTGRFLKNTFISLVAVGILGWSALSIGSHLLSLTSKSTGELSPSETDIFQQAATDNLLGTNVLANLQLGTNITQLQINATNSSLSHLNISETNSITSQEQALLDEISVGTNNIQMPTPIIDTSADVINLNQKVSETQTAWGAWNELNKNQEEQLLITQKYGFNPAYEKAISEQAQKEMKASAGGGSSIFSGIGNLFKDTKLFNLFGKAIARNALKGGFGNFSSLLSMSSQSTGSLSDNLKYITMLKEILLDSSHEDRIEMLDRLVMLLFQSNAFDKGKDFIDAYSDGSIPKADIDKLTKNLKELNDGLSKDEGARIRFVLGKMLVNASDDPNLAKFLDDHRQDIKSIMGEDISVETLQKLRQLEQRELELVQAQIKLSEKENGVSPWEHNWQNTRDYQVLQKGYEEKYQNFLKSIESGKLNYVFAQAYINKLLGMDFSKQFPDYDSSHVQVQLRFMAAIDYYLRCIHQLAQDLPNGVEKSKFLTSCDQFFAQAQAYATDRWKIGGLVEPVALPSLMRYASEPSISDYRLVENPSGNFLVNRFTGEPIKVDSPNVTVEDEIPGVVLLIDQDKKEYLIKGPRAGEYDGKYFKKISYEQIKFVKNAFSDGEWMLYYRGMDGLYYFEGPAAKKMGINNIKMLEEPIIWNIDGKVLIITRNNQGSNGQYRYYGDYAHEQGVDGQDFILGLQPFQFNNEGPYIFPVVTDKGLAFVGKGAQIKGMTGKYYPSDSNLFGMKFMLTPDRRDWVALELFPNGKHRLVGSWADKVGADKWNYDDVQGYPDFSPDGKSWGIALRLGDKIKIHTSSGEEIPTTSDELQLIRNFFFPSGDFLIWSIRSEHTSFLNKVDFDKLSPQAKAFYYYYHNSSSVPDKNVQVLPNGSIAFLSATMPHLRDRDLPTSFELIIIDTNGKPFVKSWDLPKGISNPPTETSFDNLFQLERDIHGGLLIRIFTATGKNKDVLKLVNFSVTDKGITEVASSNQDGVEHMPYVFRDLNGHTIRFNLTANELSDNTLVDTHWNYTDAKGRPVNVIPDAQYLMKNGNFAFTVKYVESNKTNDTYVTSDELHPNEFLGTRSVMSGNGDKMIDEDRVDLRWIKLDNEIKIGHLDSAQKLFKGILAIGGKDFNGAYNLVIADIIRNHKDAITSFLLDDLLKNPNDFSGIKSLRFILEQYNLRPLIDELPILTLADGNIPRNNLELWDKIIASYEAFGQEQFPGSWNEFLLSVCHVADQFKDDLRQLNALMIAMAPVDQRANLRALAQRQDVLDQWLSQNQIASTRADPDIVRMNHILDRIAEEVPHDIRAILVPANQIRPEDQKAVHTINENILKFSDNVSKESVDRLIKAWDLVATWQKDKRALNMDDVKGLLDLVSKGVSEDGKSTVIKTHEIEAKDQEKIKQFNQYVMSLLNEEAGGSLSNLTSTYDVLSGLNLPSKRQPLTEAHLQGLITFVNKGLPQDVQEALLPVYQFLPQHQTSINAMNEVVLSFLPEQYQEDANRVLEAYKFIAKLQFSSLPQHQLTTNEIAALKTYCTSQTHLKGVFIPLDEFDAASQKKISDLHELMGSLMTKTEEGQLQKLIHLSVLIAQIKPASGHELAIDDVQGALTWLENRYGLDVESLPLRSRINPETRGTLAFKALSVLRANSVYLKLWNNGAAPIEYQHGQELDKKINDILGNGFKGNIDLDYKALSEQLWSENGHDALAVSFELGLLFFGLSFLNDYFRKKGPFSNRNLKDAIKETGLDLNGEGDVKGLLEIIGSIQSTSTVTGEDLDAITNVRESLDDQQKFALKALIRLPLKNNLENDRMSKLRRGFILFPFVGLFMMLQNTKAFKQRKSMIKEIKRLLREINKRTKDGIIDANLIKGFDEQLNAIVSKYSVQEKQFEPTDRYNDFKGRVDHLLREKNVRVMLRDVAKPSDKEDGFPTRNRTGHGENEDTMLGRAGDGFDPRMINYSATARHTVLGEVILNKQSSNNEVGVSFIIDLRQSDMNKLASDLLDAARTLDHHARLGGGNGDYMLKDVMVIYPDGSKDFLDNKMFRKKHEGFRDVIVNKILPSLNKSNAFKFGHFGQLEFQTSAENELYSQQSFLLSSHNQFKGKSRAKFEQMMKRKDKLIVIGAEGLQAKQLNVTLQNRGINFPSPHIAGFIRNADLAQASIISPKRGGIDLTPANMHLQIQNTAEGIKFQIDPAILAQLQNAPGFVPVIISIQPLKNLSEFLG